MRKLTHKLTAIAFLFSVLFNPLAGALAADFKREVIYQIITDRFFDGSSTNNNPSQSFGLYDSTKTRLLGRRFARHSTKDVLPRRHGRHCDLDLSARR